MIIVYSLSYCPWCKKSIQLLKRKKLPFKVIEIEYEDKARVKAMNNMDTFPQIFYNKKKIGGSGDLEDLLEICEEVGELNIDPTIITGVCRLQKK